MPDVLERLDLRDMNVAELLRHGCPAAEPLAGVRGRRQANVCGCLCRVVHEPVDVETDPRSLGVFCTSANGGHTKCPIWQFDKDRIAAGLRSLGDELALEEANALARADDLTGSPYGDTSFMDAVEADVALTQEAIDADREERGL